jgi:hypothetical protein
VCTILLDENLTGFLRYLDSLTFNESWGDVPTQMGVRYLCLADVGLAAGTSDRDIWRASQTNRFYLLTDNREQSTEESLGTIIENDGTPTSMPVFTIGNLNRFRNEREYAEQAIKRLLDYLIEPNSILGMGRLFIP